MSEETKAPELKILRVDEEPQLKIISGNEDPAPETDAADPLKKIMEPAEPEERPDLKTQLFMSLQRNIFCDAALQGMAYGILGSVFEKNPSLNDPALFSTIEFGAAINGKTDAFKLDCKKVWEGSLSDLHTGADELVEEMKERVEALLRERKVVIGTLRIYATLDTSIRSVTLALVWAEQIKDI